MSPLPLRYKLDSKISRAIPFKPVKRRGTKPVLSVSFDDIPRSAWVNAAPILEKYGAVGTYYICGGLTGTSGEMGAHHTRQDLIDMADAGHDLACHTYSHQRCWGISESALSEELDRNEVFMRDLVGDIRFASFAYPFGIAGGMAKRAMAKRFPAARTTQEGVIDGRAMDLSQLPAQRLYSRLHTQDSIRTLVRQAAKRSAWLILYTHDVTEDPSQWGCTPGLLEAALQEAQSNGVELMSVRNGLAAALFARD